MHSPLLLPRQRDRRATGMGEGTGCPDSVAQPDSTPAADHPGRVGRRGAGGHAQSSACARVCRRRSLSPRPLRAARRGLRDARTRTHAARTYTYGSVRHGTRAASRTHRRCWPRSLIGPCSSSSAVQRRQRQRSASASARTRAGCSARTCTSERASDGARAQARHHVSALAAHLHHLERRHGRHGAWAASRRQLAPRSALSAGLCAAGHAPDRRSTAHACAALRDGD